MPCRPPYTPLIYRASQKLEIENADLRSQLRQLSSGTASSTSSSNSAARSPASTTNPSASAASPPHPLEDHAKDFDQLGRSFCTLNELWVHPSHLGQPYPENLREIGPWNSARYHDNQTKHDGLIAELYDFLPLQFHKHLEGSPFFANKVRVVAIPHCSCSRSLQFVEGVDGQRNYIISNIRQHAPAIFALGIDPASYAADFDRSEIPEIVKLLRNPNKPTEAYPRYPSILYKDGVIAAGNLFGSTAIMNVSQLTPPLTAPNSPIRYSRRYFLGQHQSPAPLESVVRGQSPLLLVLNSNRSPPGVLRWPQSL